MIDFEKKEQYDFSDLVRIMDILRGPGGCPWDLEQTHESIRRNFIEEVYEACDAIDEKSAGHLCEELGDVLLQVVFHAKMAQDNGEFTLNDVCDGICKKLILRHPHIFSGAVVSGTEEVLKNWEEIKKVEKKQKTYAQTLEEIPNALPSLIYAEKVQKRAKKAGFDWPDVSGAFDKLREETEELLQAVDKQSGVEEEFGDLLFAAVNVSRFLKVDAEQALKDAAKKFTARFTRMEELAGKEMNGMSLEQMDVLWERVKASEK